MKTEKPYVLYVDDEPDNLTVFKSTFRRDYKVFTANSASEGMQILKENPQIDVVITDQRMPEVTGVEFLESIVDDYPYSVRMILTGFSDVEAIIQAINQGQVYRYITKPWNKEQLKETIDRAIENNRKRNTNASSPDDSLKRELEEVKKELARKNHDLIQSLSYAKQIQGAMLPALAEISQALPNFFVFSLPKQYVSGDFYWFYQAADQTCWFALADCTGHGVHGGFMSIIAHDLLHEIIVARGIQEPNLILEEMHQGLRSLLHQKISDNQDSIHIGVCCWKPSDHTLTYAGARHSLVYIQGGQLHEIDGDREPVGGLWRASETKRTFKPHSLQLRDEPTHFYMFSDGFQNQLGGPRLKKFKAEPFRELLFKLHTLPVDEQHQQLSQTYDDWVRQGTQVDDVMVSGFSLPK